MENSKVHSLERTWRCSGLRAVTVLQWRLKPYQVDGVAKLQPSSRYCRNRCAQKGVGSLSAQILGGKGCPPPTNFGIRKLESLGYRMVKKIAEHFNRLSRAHQRHRRQTNDRQTELRSHIANVT